MASSDYQNLTARSCQAYSEFIPSSFSGELTDKGRETTLALGQRLRKLYIYQLKFMPTIISSGQGIYLRSTPIPRALESVQQAFCGMYPPQFRSAHFIAPTVVTRQHSDETLFPNSADCRRFVELSRAFARRTADKWNDSKEMEYLNKLLSAFMPPASPRVAVNSHPRLSGILDTVNTTSAHGPATRLPQKFYDPRAREIMEKIGLEEWFAGYTQSREFRTIGIGALLGDILKRMTDNIEQANGMRWNGIEQSRQNDQKGVVKPKFAMSGCHDSTLAAILASLGAFKGESWPPFTSFISLELFRRKNSPQPLPSSSPAKGEWNTSLQAKLEPRQQEQESPLSQSKSTWFDTLLNRVRSSNPTSTSSRMTTVSSTNQTQLATTAKYDDYYVRLRYNDRSITIPACSRDKDNHLPEDDTFCTMKAFKAVVDEFTPKNWKQECEANLGRGIVDLIEEE